MSKGKNKSVFVLLNSDEQVEGNFKTLEEAKEAAFDGCIIYEVVRTISVTYTLKYEDIKLN